VKKGYHNTYFKNAHSNKLENTEKMDKFVDTYDVPKLKKDDVKNLNRSVTGNETEAAKSFNKEKPWTRWVHC
jgi:hypothetical protein